MTIRQRPTGCCEPVRDRLRRAKGRIRNAGSDYLCCAPFGAIVDGDFPVLERIGETLDDLEDRGLASPDNRDISEIHDPKRDLLAMRRAIWPHREVSNTLVADETRPFLRDCYDHTIQLIDIVETYREIASELLVDGGGGGGLITAAGLSEARDKVRMGTGRTLAIQPDERPRLAVHNRRCRSHPEAGALHKVTVIPLVRSLGWRHMPPDQEHHTMPETYPRGQLLVLHAGRASEKLLIGSFSSRAEDDIKRVRALARWMVAAGGMSEAIGPVDLRQSEEHMFLGQSIAQPRDFSDETAAHVDAEVMKVLKDAEDRTTEISSSHRDRLETLIAQFEDNETLGVEEIRNALNPDGAIQQRAGRIAHSTVRAVRVPRNKDGHQ